MPFVRPQKPHGVSEAYAVLELEEGAPLEVIKSAYKKLSLRIHPDKNPDDPNATQQFQKISEAYRVLLKHLDNDGNSDDSDYDDDWEDEERLFELYRHLFEMVMRGEEHAFYARAHKSKPRREEEPPEQHQARIQKHLDDQKAGEERRRKERLQLKARREFEREQGIS
ncbi:hypothetical protein H2248_009343 [Termitomyces sp. 'cryptogamus']|nr:hypothetical protein H2248_009343 [Termitomyces sp. 'cryptogamus']